MMHHFPDGDAVDWTVPGLVLLFAALVIWTGHRRLRGTLPGLANGLHQLGLAALLLTFFALTSNHLPASFAWVPWLSWASTLLAQLVFLKARMVMHDHNNLVEENGPRLERPGQRMMNLQPDHQLLKAMLGHVIAAIVVLITLYYHSIPSAVSLALISISVGFSAIWAGLHTRDTLPDFAIWLEQLGVDILLSTFFGLASKQLPLSLAWLPWLCCTLSLVASLWSHSQVLLQER